MFKVGDKVRIHDSYFDDNREGVETADLLKLEGTVLEVFENRYKGTNVYHVQFKDAPYFKDYWIMYEGELYRAEVLMDGKDYEYKIKGLEEGYWRAIQHRDTRTLREAADDLSNTLHELADRIEQES